MMLTAIAPYSPHARKHRLLLSLVQKQIVRANGKLGMREPFWVLIGIRGSAGTLGQLDQTRQHLWLSWVGVRVDVRGRNAKLYTLLQFFYLCIYFRDPDIRTDVPWDKLYNQGGIPRKTSLILSPPSCHQYILIEQILHGHQGHCASPSA